MKMFIIIITIILYNFDVIAVERYFKCKTSSWSPFKSEVKLTNLRGKFYDDYLTGQTDFLTYFDVYFEGKKLNRDKDNKNLHIIKNSDKVFSYILVGEDLHHTPNHKDGLKYVYKEKKFSESTGTKWITQRNVFCEEK